MFTIDTFNVGSPLGEKSGLAEEGLARLAQIRWSPTQFQAFVDGINVRLHTVGATVFATAIQTEATDYRYAHRQGSSVTLQVMVLPDALAPGSTGSRSRACEWPCLRGCAGARSRPGRY